MARWRCNACKGTYNDTNQDGTPYFHNCGPLPPDKNGVELPRPNARQENMVRKGRTPTGEIYSEGAGVTPLDGQAETEPAWLTALKAVDREPAG